MNDETPVLTMASRLAGAVWGHLVGDAVGVPYEFGPARPASEVVFGATGTYSQPPGTWSDDGALMLALLDSLLEAGFDPEDQGRRAVAWKDLGAYTPDGDGRFDIGGTTSQALWALANGTPALEAGPIGDRASSNGSLMRILPLALVSRDEPDEALIDRAHVASRVTHGHPRCQVTCAVYVLVVARLLRGSEPDRALADALAVTRAGYVADPARAPHLAALDELEAWARRSGSGYVLDAFWSAWDAFIGATDYADTIRRAVAYGEDTDTTAAIAGGLAGASWGWSGIPLEWRRGMRGREIFTPLVDRLVGALGVVTSTSSPLRVDEIPLDGTQLDGAPGHVGITYLPGKKRDGWTGPHWRDLDLDLERLRSLGVDCLFLMVEDHELEQCRVADLPEVMAKTGPELVCHPIPDPSTPTDLPAFEAAIRDLVRRVGAGQSVAVACRGGLDRSGMAASCLLAEAGADPESAIHRVQAHRRGAITLPDQQAVVRAWRRERERD